MEWLAFVATVFGGSQLKAMHRQIVDDGLWPGEKIPPAWLRVQTRGMGRVERVMSLVLLGDLVSLYLAVLSGVDPTPTAVLDDLKSRLAQR